MPAWQVSLNHTTMQKLFIWGLFGLLTLACNHTSQQEASVSQSGLTEKIIAVTIRELLAHPDQFEGKEVAFSGLVTHVCKHGGQKCFVVDEDGESQIRIVPSGSIDEFRIGLEGSRVAFRGVFRVLNPEEAMAHLEDHEAREHHTTEMAHSAAEKADYFLEAIDFKEVTP